MRALIYLVLGFTVGLGVGYFIGYHDKSQIEPVIVPRGVPT